MDVAAIRPRLRIATPYRQRHDVYHSRACLPAVKDTAIFPDSSRICFIWLWGAICLRGKSTDRSILRAPQARLASMVDRGLRRTAAGLWEDIHAGQEAQFCNRTFFVLRFRSGTISEV